MKRKILHLVTSLHPDGAQQMMLKLLTRFNKDHFEHEIISLTKPNQFEEKFREIGVKVYSLNIKKNLSNPSGIFNLFRLVKNANADLYQGWMYHGNFALYFACLVAGVKKPIYWNIRRSADDMKVDSKLTLLIIKLNALLSSKVTKIIYCGSKIAEQHEKIGFAPSKRRVINNGFDTSQFIPDEAAKSRLRKELGLKEDVLIVGTVGRYHPQKDHSTFIKAASLIHLDNVHFVMVGRDLTEENETLCSEINSLGLGSRVHLLGQRSDVRLIVPGFDIFCLSSALEGFPNVVGEAMSAGVPCAVTDAGESAEVVGDTGFVCPRRNPEALSEAILRLLNISFTERKTLGERARIRVMEHFEINSITRLYEEEYDNAIEEHSRGR